MMSPRSAPVPFCVLFEQRKAKALTEGNQSKDYFRTALEVEKKRNKKEGK